MKRANTDHIGDTVRIQRPPPKVFTDELGRNIWMSGVDPYDIELDLESATDHNPYDSALT